ncbi:hypothetical protein HK16_01000 [Acetobacter senegalensis]|uniref:Uncharacterized protein n=2 Tax=Acetobacter TaxID=434 RepID=A0A252EEW5_9PROT|nr:hypothetical protein CIW82_06985 [Acetobacter tropicalis]OUL64852.1 hypothetical protein HK16_01000 [Acetobacter senegalensis]
MQAEGSVSQPDGFSSRALKLVFSGRSSFARPRRLKGQPAAEKLEERAGKEKPFCGHESRAVRQGTHTSHLR